MLDGLKKEFSLFKLAVVLVIITLSIYLLQILWQVLGNFSDILVILLLAWLLSFVLEPLVDFVVDTTKLSKIWSAFFVYAFFAIVFSAMVFIFIPIVITQFQQLQRIIPNFLSQYPNYLKTWNNAVNQSVNSFINLIPSLATTFVDIIIILFLSFYLIIDKEKINEELYRLTPNNWHKNLKFIQNVIDETFASFLQIQVIFGIIAAITTWIILTILGIPFAASISLLAGILSMIPLIGGFLALIPPVFVALVTNQNDPTKALIIFAVLLLAQQIIFNVIGPKLMGRAFKLHPAVVVISIIIGFKVAGPIGAIFVVPVLGIAVMVIKKLGHYFINPEFSDKK